MMNYSEDDYLTISEIAQFAFCRRRWALMTIEKQWAENEHTVIGELMHERAHDPFLSEKRSGIIIKRAFRVFSRTLGLSGECDVVEFHKCDDGFRLDGHRGTWSAYPIEYKKGGRKDAHEYQLQLAAQVMCLEEMFCTHIPEGALYHGETKRREKVLVTDELRDEVRSMLAEMHQYRDRTYVPKVKPKKACQGCSLKEICLPKISKIDSVHDYIRNRIEEDV